jgi:hypothetical protein
MQPGAGQRQDSPATSSGAIDSEKLQLRTAHFMRRRDWASSQHPSGAAAT